MTTRFLYQPHDGHTVCGVFALPHRGHVLREGTLSFHAPARWLRDFDLDFFFLGTATTELQRSNAKGLRQTIGDRRENERRRVQLSLLG